MRKFGVELEFISRISREQMIGEIYDYTGVRVITASYYDKDTTKWRLKNDGSISARGTYRYGMELVTPILKDETDLDTLARVIHVLDMFGKVNVSCGMHVHTDITDAEQQPLKKLMKYFAKYEHGMNQLIANSRRGASNCYCKDHFRNETKLYDIFGKLNAYSKKGLIDKSYFNIRGKWNFQNYWRHGSVENRAHQGTLNAEKVCNWVRLTQAIVESAFDFRGTIIKKDDTTKTYDAKDMLTDLVTKGLLSNRLKAYYLTRRDELQGLRW